jgi:hypothetical protein
METLYRCDIAFIERVFGEAWDDPTTNGDKSVEEIAKAPFSLIQVMFAIVAYAVQAMKADRDDKRDAAWAYTSEANYWAGILRGVLTAESEEASPAAKLAKMRHVETYASREQAIQYWREHISSDLSAAKAANELVRVVPFSHKTLSEWISAEKKKQ